MKPISLPAANEILCTRHYLGAARRGVAFGDARGVVVLSNPSSRHLPSDWFELSRWCILPGQPNAGSQMWASVARCLRAQTNATTVVSYSDPSAGHTGALYRACNWLWAPTWMRLSPPPSGNGNWGMAERDEGQLAFLSPADPLTSQKDQSVKDRWIFRLRADARRIPALRIPDESIRRRFPFATYDEPAGADYKTFKTMLSAGVAP